MVGGWVSYGGSVWRDDDGVRTYCACKSVMDQSRPQDDDGECPGESGDVSAAGPILNNSPGDCSSAGMSVANDAAECEALANSIGEPFNGNAGGDMYGCMRWQSWDNYDSSQGWAWSRTGEGSGASCSGGPDSGGYECLCAP